MNNGKATTIWSVTAELHSYHLVWGDQISFGQPILLWMFWHRVLSCCVKNGNEDPYRLVDGEVSPASARGCLWRLAFLFFHHQLRWVLGLRRHLVLVGVEAMFQWPPSAGHQLASHLTSTRENTCQPTGSSAPATASEVPLHPEHLAHTQEVMFLGRNLCCTSSDG